VVKLYVQLDEPGVHIFISVQLIYVLFYDIVYVIYSADGKLELCQLLPEALGEMRIFD
jgi:hypothetical protein